MNDSEFVGMIGVEMSATEFDSYGQGLPASFEPVYVQVLAVVGANHHLIQRDGDSHSIVTPNEDLRRFKWVENRGDAESLFGKLKDKAIAEFRSLG